MSVNTSRGAKERGHRQAQERDLREHFTRGETIEAYIQTPANENGGEEAVAIFSRDPVHDVRVFIDPGQHNLYRSCRVRCRVRYCGDNFLKALAVYRID